MLEGVNLKWNDFEDNLKRSFKEFRTVLNDVLIFCGSEKVYANKFVLCASSEVFRDMLVDCEISRQHNPAVILWDVDINLMSLILDFMYIGEVKISEGDLNEFLGLAKRLRVRGLVAEEPKNQKDVGNERAEKCESMQFSNLSEKKEDAIKRFQSKKKLIVDDESEPFPTPLKSMRLEVENSSDVFNDSSNKEVIDLEEVLQNTQDSMIIKTGEDIYTKQLAQTYSEQDSYLLHQSVPDLEPLHVDTALDSFNTSILDPSYKCNLCLKTYKTKGSLYNHMSLYHRGQKGE
jgi:hypothetical protein